MVALEPLASELVAPRFKQSSDDWKEVFVVPQGKYPFECHVGVLDSKRD